MAKMHYIESTALHDDITVFYAECGYQSPGMVGTRDEALVTCKRCQAILAPTHPYSVLLQYLDDDPLENATAPTFYEFVEALSVQDAIRAAKHRCCQSAGYAEGEEGYAEFYAGVEPLLVIAGHHLDLCPSVTAHLTQEE